MTNWKMPEWMYPFVRFISDDNRNDTVERYVGLCTPNDIKVRVKLLMDLHYASALVPPPNLGAALTAHNPPPSETI